MDEYQGLRQIQQRLRDARWDGGSNVIWPSVHVTAGLPGDALKAAVRAPFAMIGPGSGQVDPQFQGADPGILSQEFQVTLGVVIAGDGIGEAPLLGANRAAEDQSEGKGLLELQRELYREMKLLGPDDGIEALVVSRGPAVPTPVEGLGYIVTRDYGFVADFDTAAEYPPPANLTATVVASTVNLAWDLAADRFDRFRVVLRRASGGAAPTSITDGDPVTVTGGDDGTSAADTPGTGTFSYALFQTYDERSATPDSDDNVSASVTRLSVVVP